MYADYRSAPRIRLTPDAPVGRLIGWRDILPNWNAVTLDLAERFGIDLHDPAVLARPWPGVRAMVLSLPNTPGSHLHNALRG
jgi:hypothetical protein